MHRVRTDKLLGANDQPQSANPYLAFRRRAEKMQTRKNRKNDEDSYEKILKLSHDLRKAVLVMLAVSSCQPVDQDNSVSHTVL